MRLQRTRIAIIPGWRDRAASRHHSERALAGEPFASWAEVDVTLMIVAEVLARERSLGSNGLVDR